MNLLTSFVFFFFVFVLDVSSASPDEVEDQLMRDIFKQALFLDKNKPTKHTEQKKDFVAETNYTTETGDKRSHLGPSHDETRVILGRCDINRKCDAGQYCDGMYCFKCRSEGDHCDLAGECCAGAECQFGICTKGVAAGDPGTFCDKLDDCKGKDICCIHELSISHHHSICKPMLNEHESCGPINLFHQDVLKAHIEPVCGPCKTGLSCKGVGIHGRHSICLPDNEE